MPPQLSGMKGLKTHLLELKNNVIREAGTTGDKAHLMLRVYVAILIITFRNKRSGHATT